MINNNEILFETSCRKSYGFDPIQFYGSYSWDTVQKLFIEHYHPNGQVYNIPKKIHQIWLGGPVPDVYKKYMDSWKTMHPDWEYKLWTDKDNIQIKAKRLFVSAHNPAMKSDIMRYEILRQFGGLYVDTDFECLKPFDDLMFLDFFAGISYDSVLQLYNGLIASVPNHPIMNDCVNVDSDYHGNTPSQIMNATGPNYFTKCFLRSVVGHVVAFPTEYFYPFPNNVRDEEDPYKYVTENSYAIHHWAVSWTRRNLKKQRIKRKD